MAMATQKNSWVVLVSKVFTNCGGVGWWLVMVVIVMVVIVNRVFLILMIIWMETSVRAG